MTSLLTLGVGVWGTFDGYVRRVPRAWARLTGALALGAGAEVLGLATGFPFGPYVYTRAWWPTVELPVGPFPLALPFAWLLMAGASVLSLEGRGLRSARVPQALAGGLLAALVDLAMEPVMAGPLGYWRWREPGPLPGGAPLTNLLGWWAVGTVAGLSLTVGAPSTSPAAPRRILIGFVVLVLGLGLIGR